jgi:hypothetical protein
MLYRGRVAFAYLDNFCPTVQTEGMIEIEILLSYLQHG